MNDFIRSGRWRHYQPALLLFVLAWLFAAVPALAVLILTGLCLTAGAVYAMVVYRLHQASRAQSSVDSPYEPNVRNVTVHIVRETPWFKSARDVT